MPPAFRFLKGPAPGGRKRFIWGGDRRGEAVDGEANVRPQETSLLRGDSQGKQIKLIMGTNINLNCNHLRKNIHILVQSIGDLCFLQPILSN